MPSAVLMIQVNCPRCFLLCFKTPGSLRKMSMPPPRFFGFSRLELCLMVAWVFVAPRTCIGKRRVISSNGGHYKQQTLVSKVPDTLSFINLLLAAVQLSVGAKFELSFCVYRAWRDT
ncbi:uncharacterized protein K444DRAFT_217632 [Hyaloscypha bicolor E]|uniref:Uncharacterized protein n=1 Tax=Hyaloscypha bicolor E TaxID=1095630 RepID=A0A2J6SNY7_9HELO|nr:uncharacterized protein K444DRAFT_217632 [Hyaloscypha bicolor E]PMD52496.1 hypothetical protein K444DRAFT_217632 [Hyaloscypha bicolor E]